ncbi:MAG: hypothetical protein WA666_02310 [Nitrospirota bacterium]
MGSFLGNFVTEAENVEKAVVAEIEKIGADIKVEAPKLESGMETVAKDIIAIAPELKALLPKLAPLVGMAPTSGTVAGISAIAGKAQQYSQSLLNIIEAASAVQ